MIRSAMERSWWSGEINSPKHYPPVPFGCVSKFYPRADVVFARRTNRDSLARRLYCSEDRWHCFTVGKSLGNFFPTLLVDVEERSLALSRSFSAMRRQSGVWLSELDLGATMEFAQPSPRHGASRRHAKIPLVGISSVLGLDDGEYFAVGDARRQQYFLAQVRRGTFISEPEPTHARSSRS